MISSYENRAVTLRTADVQNQCNIIANQLTADNYLTNPDSSTINTQLTQLANIYNGRVMVIDHSMKVIRDTFGIAEGRTILSYEVVCCMNGQGMSEHNEDEGYIEFTVPIMDPDGSEIKGVILVSVSTDSITDTLDILRSKSNIIMMSIVAVMIATAAIAAFILLQPIHRIEAGVSARFAESFPREGTGKKRPSLS